MALLVSNSPERMEAFYGKKHHRRRFSLMSADREVRGREFRESTQIIFSLI